MGLDIRVDIPVFEGYLTHNLTDMAEAVGLYKILWCPEEEGIGCGEDLIEPLKKGIACLRSDPLIYRRLNPPNGWGSYDNFLYVCEKLLAACITHPQARITVSR